uniref:Expansin-like EG45 domain-containing protein n=1 Tax=Quercus lobata TaxID=97700 RepID=A0A7N2R058_QUELO
MKRYAIEFELKCRAQASQDTSACFGDADEGSYVAGVGDELWDNGAACGRQYSVICTGATNGGVPQPCTGGAVTVKIVDYNPGAATIINLSPLAFLTIATNINAGSVYVNVDQVS